jgi:hypothetical protein
MVMMVFGGPCPGVQAMTDHGSATMPGTYRCERLCRKRLSGKHWPTQDDGACHALGSNVRALGGDPVGRLGCRGGGAGRPGGAGRYGGIGWRGCGPALEESERRPIEDFDHQAGVGAMSAHRRSLPPLDALSAFDPAARLGSFKDAATEFGVTHGAISRHVRLLEDWLGPPALFRRLNRRVVLTPTGAALLAETGPALDPPVRCHGAASGTGRQSASSGTARQRASHVQPALAAAAAGAVPRSAPGGRGTALHLHRARGCPTRPRPLTEPLMSQAGQA